MTTDELREIRDAVRAERKLNTTPDWKSQIPQGSLWEPGMRGKHDCETCTGIGLLRRELPVGHPDFGRLIACECTFGNPKNLKGTQKDLL